jgi:hypothetical protein
MEIVLAAFIVSAAYVYAPLLRLHAARLLRVSLPAGAVSPTAPEVPVQTLIELPAAVAAWCERESEQFARDEARGEAKRLYAETGDWNVVLQELEKGF